MAKAKPIQSKIGDGRNELVIVDVDHSVSIYLLKSPGGGYEVCKNAYKSKAKGYHPIMTVHELGTVLCKARDVFAEEVAKARAEVQ